MTQYPPPNRRLETAVALLIGQLGAIRSCVIVITNGTSFAWEMVSMSARLGRFAAQPPATIASWTQTVFAVQSRTAHAGAGFCGGIRYGTRSRTAGLELAVDVPYAGRPAAGLVLTGSALRSIATSVEHRSAGGQTPIVYLRLEPQRGASHPTTLTGASAS